MCPRAIKRNQIMRKLAALLIVFAFCAAQVEISARADNKDKDKKGVPPGLAKKDGVPPGQAKKQEAQEEVKANPSQPAGPAPTDANATAAPSAPTATQSGTPQPNAASSSPAVIAEQKERIDYQIRIINEGTQRPHVKKMALEQIAKETGLQLSVLQEQEKNHPGIGTSALLLGNLIAKRSNAKFRDVIAEREQGRHWAEIAAWHRVPVPPLIQKSSDVASVVTAVIAANRQ